MTDKDIFLEWHVGRFVFASADVNVRTAVFLDYCGQATVGVNDWHVDLPH